MSEPDAVRFYTAESNRIHDLLDAADVPRTVGGEALSLSQRVELLTTARGLALLALTEARKGQ